MRDSDRYVNPRVVALGIVCATLVVLAVLAALSYLTARGYDPDPVLKLTAQIGTGVAAGLSLLVQLLNRAAITKTEKAAGRGLSEVRDELAAHRAELEANTDDTRQLGAALERVAEALPRPVNRHAYPDTTLISGGPLNGATPAPRGS